MNNSPTGEASVVPASQEPTGNAPVVNTAEQSQEAISHEQSQEAVSTDNTAHENKIESGGSQNDDDGLANFAKSQGFDPEALTDGERRALKIAHDNQKAYRQSNDGKKLSDTTKSLHGTDTESRVTYLESQIATDKFFAEGKDRTLESSMVDILNEKKEKFGPEYAAVLSRDLPTLYQLAQLKNSAAPGAPVDAEAIRREERESIKKQQNAGAGSAHAVTQNTQSVKIDREWIANVYQPSNPEHKKLVDEAVARGDL